MFDHICILIPAYNPNESLVSLVKEILEKGFRNIYIVNDGSKEECQPIFDKIGEEHPGVVHLVTHEVNQGKGAALKTGFSVILKREESCQFIITVDADGQHLPCDVENLARKALSTHPHLLLGVRTFSESTPFRSRVGNEVTKVLFRLCYGFPVDDTQTGLRCLSRSFAKEAIKLKGEGYQYELEMLIYAIKKKWMINQIPITTVYEPGNPTSHFNPIFDSLKIYLVLFRFAFISLLTAILDNVLFALFLKMTNVVFGSLVLARICAGLFNFKMNRRFTFHSEGDLKNELAKYFLVLLLLMTVSYGLITSLVVVLGINVVPAKIFCEVILFALSFSVQKVIVFSSKDEK